MNNQQQDEKDISKVFVFLRSQLQVKEKELLELQRATPSLLAPDSNQIDVLIDTIASLRLTTEEGSFVFESNSICDENSSATSVCSTGFKSIKTRPSSKQQHHEQHLSMFAHLLSLPIDAYLASSRPNSTRPPFEKQNGSLNRLPMVNHLLAMPINAFKPSAYISVPITTKNNKNIQNDLLSTTRSPSKSILNREMIYSKEYWLQNARST